MRYMMLIYETPADLESRRPRTRLFKVVGWTSLLLFMLNLLNAYVLFLHAQ